MHSKKGFETVLRIDLPGILLRLFAEGWGFQNLQKGAGSWCRALGVQGLGILGILGLGYLGFGNLIFRV